MNQSPAIAENFGTLNPTAMTVVYQKREKKRSTLQRYISSINLMDNAHRDKVSAQSLKKIRHSVNWLVMLALDKEVTDPVTKYTHPYKCGLATLSLPSETEQVSPEFFRTVLLTSILDAMEYHFNLKNYVWKIERQKRGALHAHITIDQYIPHEWLRSQWTKLLRKHGLTQAYHDRFSSLSLKQYIQYRIATDNTNRSKSFPSHLAYIKSLIKAHRAGEKTNWQSPNCTDIHAVRSVKSLAAYLSKYISKDPELGEGFKGRFWACSQSLNKVRNQKFHVPDKWYPYFMSCAERVCERIEDILVFYNNGQDCHFLGGLFFFNRNAEAVRSHPLLKSLFDAVQCVYHSSAPHVYPVFIFDPHHPNIFHPQTPQHNAN